MKPAPTRPTASLHLVGEVTYDRFGFAVDPSVGYARGRILATPVDDARRMAWAWERTAARVRTEGPGAFSILTGNAGAFPLAPADLELCNEWTAPGIVNGRLRELALEHLGGTSDDGFVLLSRTSATIFAWLMLYGKGKTVLSVVPSDGHGHSSIHFAAAAAGAQLIEVEAANLHEEFLRELSPSCAIITSVTSSMEQLSDIEIGETADLLRAAGCLSLLDDAYGARFRPIFHGQQRSLETGVDVAVTNGDKVGLGGPRSALVAGRPELVEALAVWAAEAGMDARGPIMVGVLRALESFTPDRLLQDAADGAELGHELTQRLGNKFVSQGPLGPKVLEEDALELVLDRCGGANPHQVRPAEVTAAVGLHVLERGIVTVNSHGQPGARVSLRLKPTSGCLASAGGAKAVAAAFDEALFWTSENLHRPDRLRAMILGS
jgi:L-seryl-tRNA(Ser) seleniumtransferase